MSFEEYFEGISFRNLLFHPAVWLILATAAMIFGATYLWEQHRYKIASPEAYTITRDNVAISVPPTWFETNLYDELHKQVFNSSTLLDQHVVPQTATYLSSIPWIQSVENVNKNPNGLSISLKYRNPVAFVGNLDRSETLVDSQGVVFDARLLTALDSNRMDNDLLRIRMPRVDISQLQPWQISADERIQHAAKLSGYILDNASDLNLFWVVSFDLPSLSQASPELELWTRNGTKILWGSSPGQETSGEASQSEKLSAIRAYIGLQGPLEEFAGKGQQMIDVRSGIAQLVAIKRVADSTGFLDSFK